MLRNKNCEEGAATRAENYRMYTVLTAVRASASVVCEQTCDAASSPLQLHYHAVPAYRSYTRATFAAAAVTLHTASSLTSPGQIGLLLGLLTDMTDRHNARSHANARLYPHQTSHCF